MKARNAGVIASAMLMAACSGSPSSMLAKGDPKICVADQILSNAYNIVMQNSQAPRSDNIPNDEYDQLKADWLGKVGFSAVDVTSVSVDRDNQSVTCSGKLHITAQGIDDVAEAPLDFQVKANLSDTKNPIVLVDVSPLQGALTSILAKVAKPDFDKAQAKHDDADDALTKQDEDLVSNTPGALVKLQARSRENLVLSLYSQADLSLIDRIYLSHMMCMAPDARNRDANCRKEVRLNNEAKSKDLCSTAGNEWYHCSRESELEYQRDAHREKTDGKNFEAVY